MRGILASLILAGLLFSQSFYEASVKDALTSVLRWRAFWLGDQSLPNYRPGKQIAVGLLRSSDRVDLFAPEIRLAVELDIGRNPPVAMRVWSIAEPTINSAISAHAARQSGVPHFVIRPGNSSRAVQFGPEGGGSQSESRPWVRGPDLKLRLPNLTAPLSVLRRERIPAWT